MTVPLAEPYNYILETRTLNGFMQRMFSKRLFKEEWFHINTLGVQRRKESDVIVSIHLKRRTDIQVLLYVLECGDLAIRQIFVKDVNHLRFSFTALKHHLKFLAVPLIVFIRPDRTFSKQKHLPVVVL